MNNWGGLKYMVSEVDTYKKFPDYDLYGDFNVNYVKLDRVPTFDDWSPVCRALRAGEFFVTTGEVLIPKFTVGGKESGHVATRAGGDTVEVRATIEWTFPPAFAEIIWGDGKQVRRHRVDLAANGALAPTELAVRVAVPGAKWVRLEAWDVAANGAFSQPVWLE